MKKLAIVLTLISSVAFAQKHMVRFDANGNSVNDVQVKFDTNDNGTDDNKSNEFAFNYAYTVAPQWQVGIRYAMSSTDNAQGTANEYSENTIGLSGYWNKEEDLMNTCYFGLHYDMTSYTVDEGAGNGSNADGDKMNTITLEYGHRFALGKIWGATMTYSPNVTYAMSTTELDAGGDDVKTTSFGINWLKFDMLF